MCVVVVVAAASLPKATLRLKSELAKKCLVVLLKLNSRVLALDNLPS